MCFRTETCCCCCSVEKGSKIIAYVEIIFSSLGLAGFVFGDWGAIVVAILGVFLGFLLYGGVTNRSSCRLITYLVITAVRFLGCLAFGIWIIVYGTDRPRPNIHIISKGIGFVVSSGNF